MGDAPPAAAPEEATEEADAPPEAPDFGFDAAQHTLVVDLGGLCAIPYDAQSSAIESLRAFRFEKGRAMHGPQAGTYAVAGTQETLSTLMRVHFAPATKRKPELVISFADYAMASDTTTGIFVCSLALPLLKRKNVYENTIRYTNIDAIVGFSKINEGNAPWSIHLKPALQKLGGIHSTFKLFTSADVAGFIGKPLAERIPELKELARQSLSHVLEGLRRQDKNLAEKQGAHFEAQLQSTVDFLLALPPASYDKPLKERIIEVTEGEGAQGSQGWLTPSKVGNLLAAEVQAEGLARTAKCKRSISTASAPDRASASMPVVPEEAEEADGEPDDDAQERDLPAFEGYSLKRVRKQPAHFEFSRSSKKKGAAKAKELPEINPRTGKPWVRGPYEKERKNASGVVLAEAAKAMAPIAVPIVDRSAERETIAKLKAKIAELENKLVKVESELEHEKSQRALCVANARLEVRESMAAELLTKYQQGLHDGANLSQGRANLAAFKLGGITSPDCSGSSSSMSRFS